MLIGPKRPVVRGSVGKFAVAGVPMAMNKSGNLIAFHDTILPRLISGEMEVKL